MLVVAALQIKALEKYRGKMLERWVGKDVGYPAVSLSATRVPYGDRRRRSEGVRKDDRVQIENQIGGRVPPATSI